MAEQKKYSHVVAIPKDKDEVFFHIEAFVTRDAELNQRKVGNEDRDVTNFGIAGDNIAKAINRAFGSEVIPVQESTFADVAVWGYDAPRASKIAKKGNRISVTGTLKIEEREGVKYLKVTAQGFNLLWSNPKNKADVQSAPEPVAAGAGAGAGAQDDLPF